MTIVSPIDDHQARCRPHLLRLKMIAAAVLTPKAAGEVSEATGAILAEAEAAGNDARAAAGLCGGGPGAATLLQVRLDRLATTADEAIAAAGAGDAAQMLRHLRRFDALTAAIWTVQQAVYGPRR